MTDKITACRDCRHFSSSNFNSCHNDKYVVTWHDVVTGKLQYRHDSAYHIRADRNLCGYDAKGFEPKTSWKFW